ncbi:MAG: Nif3-like dinuclear metal center hexameric protein [Atribacterota bacterium]
MKIRELINIIDRFAPFFLQQNFDNSGVQYADLDKKINKVLICLDVTIETIEEALKQNCNTILSHHPLFFQPLTKITKQDNPTTFQLTHHQINLISAHTNYDLAENGLNDYVGRLLELKKIDSLEPSSEKILKLALYVPQKYQDNLLNALFKVGAGRIGDYSETSFIFQGKGSFKPLEGTKPFIGNTGKRELVDETKIETVFRERDLDRIIETIHKNHPYEEPAYDIYQLNSRVKSGIGLIARLAPEQNLTDFAVKVKNILNIPYLRMVQANNKKINTIALCTGSGGSLINRAHLKNADLLITGDIKHHEALRAREIGLNIIDIEHFHTEKYFVPAIFEQLIEAQVPKNLLHTSKKTDSPFQLL